MADTEPNFAQVEGHSIAYREAGQGPALVLLHGFLCDSRCWRRQVTELSDRFRVVAWDAPGAGSSSDPTEPFTTADYARCLARFLDELGVVRAHLLGLSWGGILAQGFYRMYPQRLRCLLLADTYAGWKGSLPEPARRERLASCLRDAIARSPVHVAEQLHAAIPGAELAIIPEAGHLSNMEQPEVFNAHVRRFCLSRDTE